MHRYEVDAAERRWVPLLLLVIALALSWLVNAIVGWLGYTWPWWLEGASPLAIYGLVYKVWDRWIWRLGRGARLLAWAYGLPDLRGRWNVTLVSSYSREVSIQCVLWIEQRWSDITLRLVTPTSESVSCTAAVVGTDTDQPRLIWTYENSPDRFAGLDHHHGTCEMCWQGRLGRARQMRGSYYTDRTPQTCGTMEARWQATERGDLKALAAALRADAPAETANPAS